MIMADWGQGLPASAAKGAEVPKTWLARSFPEIGELVRTLKSPSTPDPCSRKHLWESKTIKFPLKRSKGKTSFKNAQSILEHFSFTFFYHSKPFTELHPGLFHVLQNMVLGQTLFMTMFHPALVLQPTEHQIFRCRRHKCALSWCQELGARALGSAATAVSNLEISAGFREQVGGWEPPKWQICVCPCTIPFSESPSLNLFALGGFVTHVLSWHWRSQGEKGSDAAAIGHQHHLLPVHSTLKTRKLSWKKGRKSHGYVIWDSCCLLVIKFVTILTELGTMEGIRKKRQREGKYKRVTLELFPSDSVAKEND